MSEERQVKREISTTTTMKPSVKGKWAKLMKRRQNKIRTNHSGTKVCSQTAANRGRGVGVEPSPSSLASIRSTLIAKGIFCSSPSWSKMLP